MERNEAVTCLKEISSNCIEIYANNISLVDSKPAGYTLQIKAFLDKNTKEKVKIIAQKHRLEIKEVEDGLIIYKPAQALTFV